MFNTVFTRALSWSPSCVRNSRGQPTWRGIPAWGLGEGLTTSKLKKTVYNDLLYIILQLGDFMKQNDFFH